MAVWSVDEEGFLRWRGADAWSSAYLADLLSGEDDGRIPADDVELLFATLPRVNVVPSAGGV